MAWRTGVREGLAAIQRVGEAEPGDRTLVDTLAPARDALGAHADPGGVAEAALKGAPLPPCAPAGAAPPTWGNGPSARLTRGALGVALLLSCRARVAGDAPGELADHLPGAEAERAGSG